MLKRLVELRNFLVFKNFDRKAKNRKHKLPLNKKANFIISISSYPKRIHLVPAVFESLARQKSFPKKYILVLTEEEWPNKNVPKAIHKLVKSGVEILWVQGNSFAVKNISPVVAVFPEDDILILDDDIIYGPEVVRDLCESDYVKKGWVVGHVAKSIFRVGESLSMWHRYNTSATLSTQSESVFFIGYSGVYYPKNSLDHRVTNLEAIKRIVPGRGKDIWLYCATIAKGTSQVCLGSDNKRGYYIPIPVTEDTKPKEWVTGEALDNRFQMALDYFQIREWLLNILPEKNN